MVKGIAGGNSFRASFVVMIFIFHTGEEMSGSDERLFGEAPSDIEGRPGHGHWVGGLCDGGAGMGRRLGFSWGEGGVNSDTAITVLSDCNNERRHPGGGDAGNCTKPTQSGEEDPTTPPTRD